MFLDVSEEHIHLSIKYKKATYIKSGSFNIANPMFSGYEAIYGHG